MRARAPVAALVAVLVVVAVSAIALTRSHGTPSLAVFPSPGASYASPRTQIALRGAPAGDLGKVTVRGSRSGVHAGRLVADSDGAGASFLPDRAFTPGERVTVRVAGAELLGATHGAVSFTVADMPAPHQEPVAPANARRRGTQGFVTLPDLQPPGVVVTRRGQTAPGDVFVAPKLGDSQWGPMILDGRGRTVWFRPNANNRQATDFHVQTYRGRPVLTWWEGRFAGGHGDGEDVIADTSYRRVATVHAANGYQTDLHEFRLTPQGTALVTAYVSQPRDLRPWGGVQDGRVLDCVVQEIDVRTGLVLFEWHSLDHVSPDASYIPAPKDTSRWDYFHVNSVDEMPDGSLLISGRHTSQLYDVDRRTGAVRWRMGGMRSDFRLAAGAQFNWQHDARAHPDGTITVFDNGSGSKPTARRPSMARRLRIDGHTVRLVRSWSHAPPIVGSTQGDAQVLPDGHVFVGWGNTPYFSEFTASGAIVFDGRFTSPGDDTYRAYRAVWHARPPGRPLLVARAAPGGGTTVWVSWNGATEVARWRLLTGDAPGALHAVGSIAWDGLETATTMPFDVRYVEVQALSAAGKVLGASHPVAVVGG